MSNGELVYALVARGSTILAEYTGSSGNFTMITQSIIDKIPAEDSKCTYVYDRYLFHYIRQDGIVYLCMGDEAFGRRIPFAFLIAIQKDFESFATRASNAIAYSMNRDFGPVLKRQMTYFSKGAGGDKLAKVKGEVEQVKGIMVENIERVLERGEHMDLLVDKSENLGANARLFNRKSSKLRNQMWWENQRWLIGLICIVVAIILIIVLSVAHKKNKNKITTTRAPLYTTYNGM